MASTAYVSSVSSITYAGTTFEAVGTMSVSASRTPIEVTQVGCLNTFFLAGMHQAAINLDIYYNKTNHQVLVNALMAGTRNAFTFTAGASDDVSGYAYVTGVDVIATQGDIVRGSVSFQVDGQLTFAGTSSALGGNEV